MTDRFENDSDEQHDGEARILREEAATLEREAHTLENTAHAMEDRAHDLEERARKIDEAHEQGHHGDGDEHGHGDGGHSHEAKVLLKIVVNGTPTMIEALPQEPLGEIRKEALEKTKNVAQPPENWEIKNEAGELLDPFKTVGDYHLSDGATLFLSLRAGVAGA